MSNGVITINEEGVIEKCNPSCMRLMQVEKEEDIIKTENFYFLLFFTGFCFVALINALNFYDGINNQLSQYLIILGVPNMVWFLSFLSAIFKKIISVFLIILKE